MEDISFIEQVFNFFDSTEFRYFIFGFMCGYLLYYIQEERYNQKKSYEKFLDDIEKKKQKKDEDSE